MQLTILAEVASEAPALTAEWLKVVIYLAGIAFLALSIIARWKEAFGRKPPLDEELKQREEKAAREMKERQERAEQQREALHAKVDALGVQLTTGREEDRKAIYSRINHVKDDLSKELKDQTRELSADLASLQVQVAKTEQLTETHTQQLAAVHTTQERILERLPRRG